MGLWKKLFGKKYLSWDEYQDKMQALEDAVWQKRPQLKKPVLPEGLKEYRIR